MKTKTVIFPIGLSGCGKSTFIKTKLTEYINFNKENISDIIVSCDNIRLNLTGDINNHNKEKIVWIIAETLFNEIITENNFVIIDNTNLVRKNRKPFLNKNNKNIAFVFKPNIEEFNNRIITDLKNNVNRSNVSKEILEKQFISFSKFVVNDNNWDGIWNKKTKEKIMKNLSEEFDEIYFIED